jgi:hypothetical protein
VQPAHQLNLLREAPDVEINSEKTREDRVDHFIKWMDDDHRVDIVEKLKTPRVLRDFTKNPIAPQSYKLLVARITWHYDLGTYMRAVDSCLASTTSTQGDSPLSRIALIASPLDESSWNDCLIFTEIAGCPMVTMVYINQMVIVDDTDNEIKYIICNPSTWNEHRPLG